ncbi:type II toxin-antitoxin system VapB family antitoxin [Candidatus Aerophobetes bacterium]|nr:type II toxin-antitoxin system VapB family antitoxin [Candidatus Aerophobetes bacterium]
MGKTTVVIDDKLINEAIKATGARTKREVIEKGLRELIKAKNREALREELGTYELDLSLQELKKLRNEQ